ncbi:MAG: hypothetical protein M3Y65_25565 [Pseudomonadota bacterium]|nr:hypothetical protein [Pseudomonadota bacterium]
MRAFVRLREVIVSNKDMALRLDAMESATRLISPAHDTLEYHTQVQMTQVSDAIRALMAPPEPVQNGLSAL